MIASPSCNPKIPQKGIFGSELKVIFFGLQEILRFNKFETGGFIFGNCFQI